MFKKYFTLSEANKRLPLVATIVAEILQKGKALKSFLDGAKGESLPAECLALQEEIENLMAELEELGCFYKDWNFEIGLVDFPAQLSGQEVLLCWRSDEKNIRFYHTLDGGYAGRKMIPENLE